MIFIGKAWHSIVGLLFEARADQATLCGCAQHGQASAMQQIMNERGDKDCFASTREAGDAKAQARPACEIREAARGDARFGEKGVDQAQGRGPAARAGAASSSHQDKRRAAGFTPSALRHGAGEGALSARANRAP